MRRIAFWLVWAFVFTVPWQNVLVIPGVGTISKLLGIIALGLGLLAVVTSARLRPLRPFHLAALAFVAWGSASFYWSVYPAVTAYWITTNLQLLAVVWLVWELGAQPSRGAALLQAYVLGAHVAAFATINSYRLGVVAIGPQTNQRFGAGEFNVNDLGFLLAMALPMAWHFSVTHRHAVLRWVNRLYLPVGALAVVLTASRGALIVALAGCAIVLPSTLTKLRPRAKMAVGAVLVISVLVALRFAPTGAIQRLATTKAELTGGTLNDRVQVWRAAFELVPQRPVQGSGGGTFKMVIRTSLGFGKNAHNAYISVLTELGVVGLMLFLAMFATAFFHARGSPRELRPLATALLVALSVGLLPRGAASEKSTWLLLAFTLPPLVGSAPAAAGAARARGVVGPPGRRASPVLAE